LNPLKKIKEKTTHIEKNYGIVPSQASYQ